MQFPSGPAADQITFTREFAYVRAGGSEFVTMIKTAELGKEASVSRFPCRPKGAKESPASSLLTPLCRVRKRVRFCSELAGDSFGAFWPAGKRETDASFPSSAVLIMVTNSLPAART